MAEELPYKLPGARRPSLATVYVRQDVTSGTDTQPVEQSRPLPVLDSRGQLIDLPPPPVARLTVRPPSRSMREALDTDDHLLVTGGPGQGKSTLSLRLAADVARRWHSDDTPPLEEPVVPLRLTARELAARLDLPFFEALAETVRAEFGALLAYPIRPDDLAERVAGCRWLLLVDGLDEVADTVQRDRLVAVLSTWASDPATADYRVIVTTRPIEGATLAPFQRIGAARYELLPFDERALRRFAEHWFSDSDGDAAKFLRQLRDAHLDELVRVPLLATIAAIIFQQYDDRPLPDNQYELYETYLGHLRSAHPPSVSPFDEHCGLLLEHLGRVRLEEDTSLTAAACAWAADHLPRSCLSAGWQERLITHLAAVGPFISRSDDLRFLHHSFAEHLAATARARLLPAEFDAAHPEFVELLHAARPEDRGRYARRVLLHHTRLHPAEADRLLAHLHGGDPDQHLLAARLLAWHVPADAEAFFATADAWAMTTQDPSREILSQVSRATHHPGLFGWLLDLMRDDDAPWPSRVEAAVALATRLNSDARPEALETLRSVLNDTAIAVQCRLDAAEALSQCGTDEQHVAVLGLRSVLETPSTTAAQYSDAAVVLAGLGPEARDEAIEALTRLLDDRTAPDSDLVAAAVGLVEVDPGFHERCAAVFRKVLDRRSWSTVDVREAARGLASLGPDQLAEAAAALERRITDSRLHLTDQIQAAGVLAELGPQHRIRAGELLLTLARPGKSKFHTAYALSTLLDCGPEFHEPATLGLRSLLGSRLTEVNDLVWAGLAFAGLGPGARSDAVRALERLASHPLADSNTRMNALGQLVSLGEPHRTAALAELRAAMTDEGAVSQTRLDAANEISRLGPEFHPAAMEQLTKLTSPAVSPGVRMLAWRRLRSLTPRLDQQASAVLVELLTVDAWEGHRQTFTFFSADIDRQEDAAEALGALLGNSERSGRQRHDAARNMLKLGRLAQCTAAHALMEMLRDRTLPQEQLGFAAKTFCDVSADLRRELISILRTMALSPASRAGLVCAAAGAAADMDAVDDPDLFRVLDVVVMDISVDALSRSTAVSLLARHEPARLPAAAALVLRLHEGVNTYVWERQVWDLAGYGAEIAPGLGVLLSDPLAPQSVRQRAAAILAKVCPDRSGEAITELRAQATDEFLAIGQRMGAVARLADAAPSTVGEAVAFLRVTMTDERAFIDDRCEAAYDLARLDQSASAEARHTLLVLAGASELTPQERGEALYWLDYLHPAHPSETRLRLVVVHDPAAPGGDRVRMARDLPGKDRREVERTLVADRLLSPGDWPNSVNEWDDKPLAVEAERVLRDMLAGPETTVADRITAAVALSSISPRYEADAVAILADLSRGRSAVSRVRRELASLDRTWHNRVLADALGVLTDVTRAARERARAGLIATELISELSPQIRARLEELLDRRIAERIGLKILVQLGRLDEIRAIRDDESRNPQLRKTAAKRLRSYEREDRAAAARVLHAIAIDASCRPQVRWRAADDLVKCGVRGQELGTAALESIMTDETLPVLARRDAACALGPRRPDLRGEILAVLRRFRRAEDPRTRIQVFKAIGLFEPAEGAIGLSGLARDSSLSSAVRLRGADAAARMHRDHRESAAVVAREIAHDERVPRHVRVKAARLLAMLSELCRPEARQVLERLR